MAVSKLQERLKAVVERTDTPLGKAFDAVVQTLILISILSFSLETLPDLVNRVRRFLGYVELLTVTVFTVEYILRIFVADRKKDYIFSFFGILDLLAILPFYLRTGLDLRAIRIFRLLRPDLAAAFQHLQVALGRLEGETLIARNGDLYFFLTNEERDIGREIKNIAVPS